MASIVSSPTTRSPDTAPVLRSARVVVLQLSARRARAVPLRSKLTSRARSNAARPAQVTDHCAIDLDQNAILEQVILKTPEGFEKSRDIYNNGGHSKSYASVILDTGLSGAVSKGAPVLALNKAGEEVTGKMYSDYDAGVTEIKVQYATLDDQANYVGCQVGALVEPNMNRCFAATGAMKIGDSEYQYTYDPATDNKNGRTM